jgi:hypothetical protein
VSIGSVNSNNALSSALQANGLSADKIALVADDLQQVEQAQGAPVNTSVDSASVRQALEKKIDEDVKAGKLSQEDATAIKKTLDDMGGASRSTTQASKAAAGGKPHGGGGHGGGGGSSQKTILSEVVTVTGALQTTLITYTDDTTDTETQPVTGDSTPSGSSTGGTTTGPDQTASDYLSTIDPGSLYTAYA